MEKAMPAVRCWPNGRSEAKVFDETCVRSDLVFVDAAYLGGHSSQVLPDGYVIRRLHVCTGGSVILQHQLMNQVADCLTAGRHLSPQGIGRLEKDSGHDDENETEHGQRPEKNITLESVYQA